MTQDTNRMLKEISDLTKNMDGLFRELKENAANSKETNTSIRELAKGISDNKKQITDPEALFKGFTESFMKSFQDQNRDIVNTLTKSLGDSVTQFANNIPNQIAQVKSGTPLDYGSLLGGNTIGSIVSNAASKIPGLKKGGKVKKGGLVVVGEDGPEMVELAAGDTVVSGQALQDKINSTPVIDEEARRKREEQEAAIEASLVSKSGASVVSDEADLMDKKLRSAVAELIPNDADLRSKFLSYAKDDLDKDEWKEFIEDRDYLKEEIDYFKEYVLGRETMTLEDIQKLSKPVTAEEMSSIDQKIEARNQETTASLSEKVVVPESVQPKEETRSIKEEASAVLNKAEEKLNFSNVSSNLLGGKNASLYKALGFAPPAKESESSKSGQSESTASTPAEAKNGDTSRTTPSSTQPTSIESSMEKMISSVDNKKELNDIKGLLASIYSILRGPLSVNRDEPYRPYSNQF